jgi:hypothetical protein
MDKCFTTDNSKKHSEDYIYTTKEVKLRFDVYEVTEPKKRVFLATKMTNDKTGKYLMKAAKRWFKVREDKLELIPSLISKGMLYYDKALPPSANAWAVTLKRR